MAWGYRELRGPEERRASKLAIPQGLSRGTRNLTVLEEAQVLVLFAILFVLVV
jgi:hypothetical protein